jgi:hypothetical protein
MAQLVARLGYSSRRNTSRGQVGTFCPYKGMVIDFLRVMSHIHLLISDHEAGKADLFFFAS